MSEKNVQNEENRISDGVEEKKEDNISNETQNVESTSLGETKFNDASMSENKPDDLIKNEEEKVNEEKENVSFNREAKDDNQHINKSNGEVKSNYSPMTNPTKHNESTNKDRKSSEVVQPPPPSETEINKNKNEKDKEQAKNNGKGNGKGKGKGKNNNSYSYYDNDYYYHNMNKKNSKYSDVYIII